MFIDFYRHYIAENYYDAHAMILTVFLS